MEYLKYKTIFDRHLKIDNITNFVKTLVKSTDAANRLMSSFKVFSLKDRIATQYLTSINIKLGDALEDIFKEYLKEQGVVFLPRNFVAGKDCDQIFQYNGTTFLIEQKIRDDHDSSKKIGQAENYTDKKSIIQKQTNNNCYCCCWFIDPDFTKNKNYYISVLSTEEVYYGREIEYFLREKVFHDNRCNNFFQELNNSIERYTNEFSIFDTSNLTIDYHNFTTTELYRLLKFKSHINTVATIFFNNNIPFQEIYNYISKRSRVDCTEDFKKLLKEYMQ